MRTKLLLLAVIAVVVAVFFALDLHQYLSFEYIKASRERFDQLYAESPYLVAGAYFVIYVLVTGFSLPGATPLTLAGGFLLGFWPALITISFASTIGATIACSFARFLLQDWVQSRVGKRLAPINQGVEREGAFYLFTLRLVPIFPFFVINLAMGLTKMPLLTFYWVSQVGMLPGTVVYVNAGTQLGQIESLSGILSPGLILSFAILGLFPITVKKLLAWYRARTGRAAVIRSGEGEADHERQV